MKSMLIYRLRCWCEVQNGDRDNVKRQEKAPNVSIIPFENFNFNQIKFRKKTDFSLPNYGQKNGTQIYYLSKKKKYKKYLFYSS